jgi:hypothetical protein
LSAFFTSFGIFGPQLVTMTILELTNQDLSEAQKSTEKIGILSEFQSKDPGKFRRLEDRLVAPSRCQFYKSP